MIYAFYLGFTLLIQGNRALENVDVNASYDMYSKACSLYEQEDRGRFAVDIFKKAISLLIRNKKQVDYIIVFS